VYYVTKNLATLTKVAYVVKLSPKTGIITLATPVPEVPEDMNAFLVTILSISFGQKIFRTFLK
jgi:hypothetical protein